MATKPKPIFPIGSDGRGSDMIMLLAEMVANGSAMPVPTAIDMLRLSERFIKGEKVSVLREEYEARVFHVALHVGKFCESKHVVRVEIAKGKERKVGFVPMGRGYETRETFPRLSKGYRCMSVCRVTRRQRDREILVMAGQINDYWMTPAK